MPKIFLSLLLAFSIHLSAQTIDSVWLSKNYTKLETMIPMRDGIKLFTSIYCPRNTSEKHPILMMRTPYSVSPYGKNRYSSLLSTSHFSNYVKESYIIVMQDVRGRYMSEGQFIDVRPFIQDKKTDSDVDEASDAYDAIDWLVKNTENSNGNVGVTGISYPGFYATMAALSNHAALKAVSPQAPVTDWFMGDDFHHNGAFALADAFSFYSGFGRPRPKPTTIPAKGYNMVEKDIYAFFLKHGAIKNFTKLMPDTIKFWNDLMKHPNYDEFWQSRDARRFAKNVKPAILVVGGLFDPEDCYGAWNLYKAISQQSPETETRLVMGPWFHGGWHRSDGSYFGSVRFGTKTSFSYHKNIEVPFFNAYLKETPGGATLPKVSIFFTGENKWHSLNSWPPPNVDPKPVYLSANRNLSYNKPETELSFSTYTSNPGNPVPYAEGPTAKRTREYMIDDQRFAAKRNDVLVFETGALSSELQLGGSILVDLKVKINTTDADFIVKIIDVFPDDFKYDTSVCCKGVKQEAKMGGYQMLVRGEIMRGKFRHSFERPEPFDTLKIETVKFLLPDVAHIFKPGHRLMVQIQSSWFPLFDRNPQRFTDIYSCENKDFVPARIEIYHQANAASYLVLPVLINK